MTTTRRSIAEWEQIFREHEASGESVETFCTRRGVALSPFYRYRRRLRTAPPVPGVLSPAFVPVTVTPRGVPAPIDRAPTNRGLSTADTVTLTIGQVSMTLSSSVPPAWVAALLTALET